MLSVIHGRDEFTNLPEAPCTTENEGIQAPYGISQHRTIAEKEEKDVGLGTCRQKSFSELLPLERQENTLLEHWMKAAVTIDICSQSES